MAGIKPTRLTASKVVSTLLNTAQSSYYRITIPVPPQVKNFLRNIESPRGRRRGDNLSTNDYSDIELLCCEASLPGSSLTTHEVNNDYHGITEKMAYRRMYDEVLSLTFYVDRDYKVIQMLEGWMNYITGVDVTNHDPYVNYRMSYPSTYKNNINLTKFERDHFVRDINLGSEVTTYRSLLDYTFVQAFPLSVTAIPVSYESGEVLKCNASFNYVRYTMERGMELVTDINERNVINRDPSLGVPDLRGTTATFS